MGGGGRARRQTSGSTLCTAIGSATACEAAGCVYGNQTQTVGPQCDGWTGATYSRNTACLYGQFLPGGGPGVSVQQTCFARNATQSIGDLWDIQGVAAGATSIADGGHDMYDIGNVLRVRARPSPSRPSVTSTYGLWFEPKELLKAK